MQLMLNGLIKSYYEAIFYKENLEHIAHFDLSGNLTEYKLFLPKEFLPEAIKSYLESKGEIMNVVLNNKGNCIEYEAIVRDKNLTRSLILLSDLGKILEEKFFNQIKVLMVKKYL